MLEPIETELRLNRQMDMYGNILETKRKTRQNDGLEKILGYILIGAGIIGSLGVAYDYFHYEKPAVHHIKNIPKT